MLHNRDMSCPSLQRVQFKQVFPDASSQAIDLLARMLQFDPRKRITVEEALQHPYLAQLHDPSAEPAAPREWGHALYLMPLG